MSERLLLRVSCRVHLAPRGLIESSTRWAIAGVQLNWLPDCAECALTHSKTSFAVRFWDDISDAVISDTLPCSTQQSAGTRAANDDQRGLRAFG